ncbi:hypothetical protein [Thioflexithrix psekupsensis]|uniref:Peptidase S1 domain-containing protein n=1 Tax=Thioflexithrix psekupsensis TaxID=1570016 RepID=A0A251X4U3_9GAMM|nr:hypothetical protein [Thioflexithrix psekupsensis]OUD12219.1 hypothetical protein TPSD3_13940 [Thioflexithrix psekupsensis]
MLHHYDDIKDYAVKITVQGTKSGSGVIVKPTENASCFYILTARHTFKKDKSDELLDREIIYQNYVRYKNKLSSNI